MSIRPEKLTVSASRKIQLSQYEPVEAFVEETYSVPEGLSREAYEEFRAERQDEVMAAAEQAAMRRHEEYVREEAFGED